MKLQSITTGRALYIVLACFTINCGAPDDKAFNEQDSVYDYDESVSTSEQAKRLEPKTNHKNVKDVFNEYVTNITAETNCEDHEHEFAVAKNHENFGQCERIILTAKNQDKTLNGNSVNFLWFVADPSVVELVCPVENDNKLCRSKGKLDIFDNVGGGEPKAAVIACAINNCLDSQPKDCHDLVCSTISIASVFNLEGGWLIHGDTLKKDLIMIPYQDGRRFVDHDLFIHDGLINGLTIQFEMDGRIFTGEILSQNHLQGTILDSTDMSVVGQWFAERLS